MRTASFRDNASLNTSPKQFYRLLRGNQDYISPTVKSTPPRSERCGGTFDAHTCTHHSFYYLLIPKEDDLGGIPTFDMANGTAGSPVSARQSKHVKVNAAWQTTHSSLSSTYHFHVIFTLRNCCPFNPLLLTHCLHGYCALALCFTCFLFQYIFSFLPWEQPGIMINSLVGK